MEKSSKKVLLDANFLTLPQQFRVDVVAGVRELVPGAELVTLEPVVRELEKLEEGRIGMELVKKGLVKVETGGGKDVDEEIVQYAVKEKAVVCTNDKELGDRLARLKVPVIYLRERRKLELKGVIK